MKKILLMFLFVLALIPIANAVNVTFSVFRVDATTPFYCETCYIEDLDNSSNNITISAGNGSAVLDVPDNIITRFKLSANMITHTSVDYSDDYNVSETTLINFTVPDAKINTGKKLLVVTSTMPYCSGGLCYGNLSDYKALWNTTVGKILGYSIYTEKAYNSNPASSDYVGYDTIVVTGGSDISDAVKTAITTASPTTLIISGSQTTIGSSYGYNLATTTMSSGSAVTSTANMTYLTSGNYFSDISFNGLDIVASSGWMFNSFCTAGGGCSLSNGFRVANTSLSTNTYGDARLKVQGASSFDQNYSNILLTTFVFGGKNIIIPSYYSVTGGSGNYYQYSYDFVLNSLVGYDTGALLPAGTQLSGVTFVATESVAGCNLGDPVPNCICSIASRSCTTQSPTIVNKNVTNATINILTEGGRGGYSYADPVTTSHYIPLIQNPLSFLLQRIGIPIQTFEFTTDYLVYNSPTNLDRVNLSSVLIQADQQSYEYGSVGFKGAGRWINCTYINEESLGTTGLDALIVVMSGYNTTHYRTWNLSCVDGQQWDYGTGVYYWNISTVNSEMVDYFSQNPANVKQMGADVEVLTDGVLRFNTTYPIYFDLEKDRIYKQNFYFIWVNDSVQMYDYSCGWIGSPLYCPRDLNQNDIAYSEYKEKNLISYRYNESQTAGASCSVGNLPVGTYNYTCEAPSGYVFSNNSQTTLTDSVTIKNSTTQTQIQVYLSKVRPLSLELTILDKSGSVVIGASCESDYSVNTTDMNGKCLLPNMPVNTNVPVTINPNRADLEVLTDVEFAIGDYYNSENRGDNPIRNFCRSFDGIYRYIVPYDKMQSTTITFIVYDPEYNPTEIQNIIKTMQQDQAIFQEWFLRDYGFYAEKEAMLKNALLKATVKGATVSIDNDNDKKCVTGEDGSCTVTWTPDFAKHSIISYKYPQYLLYQEPAGYLVGFSGYVVFLQRNASWWAEHPEGEISGAGGIGGMFVSVLLSPIFIGFIFCLALGGAGTVLSRGNGIIGVLSFMGGFLTLAIFGIFPFWLSITFVVLAGGVFAWFFGQIFIGGGK